MSTHKRVNGDYAISTVGASDNVSITTHTVTITGNLNVAGTQTTVNSTDTDIADRLIVLNKGESGAGVTGNISGIQLDRGSSTDARLAYVESVDKWNIDQGNGTLTPIVSSASGLTTVVDDTSPQLGGDLDINSNSIVSTSNGNIAIAPNGSGITIINSAIKLSEESDPSGEANVTKLYAKEAGSGGTGLYFVTDTFGPDELVSKSKAIVYGIIF